MVLKTFDLFMFKHGRLKKFVALIILDGWGIAESGSNNLVSSTPTPQFDKMVETYPSTVLINPLDIEVLQAAGEDACRLSHYAIGTSNVENNLSALEKRDPLKTNSLSRILSQNNLKQLYLTDSEKFPQLSYFFRGCYAKLLKNEKQVLAKSSSITADVGIKNIVKELKKQLETRKFNFIVINLSNIDIAAHAGNREATVRAIELVDKYLGQIVEKILGWGGEILVTADHGKAEKFSSEQELKPNHTTSKVPFIFVSENFEGKSFPGIRLLGTELDRLKPSGFLTDIAPTILKMLNIKKPDEMAGRSLV
jgi:bisphosphoglycerate-independent phosphoglycerate mutase (AlkP superfamily)